MAKDRRREKLKNMLLNEKRRIWGGIREDIFRKLGGEVSPQYNIPSDLEDLSVLDTIEDTGLAIAGIRKDQLIRIEEALRKIEDNNYGQCSNCGREIDEERLKAMPSTELCIDCQNGREAGEGRKPTL